MCSLKGIPQYDRIAEKSITRIERLWYVEPREAPLRGLRIGCLVIPVQAPSVDSVKQHGRFTDNHLGRSTGMIVGRYPVMVVAPCC